MADLTEIKYIERIVAVETNLVNLTKAVNDSGKETTKAFTELNQKLDQVLPTFVTKEQHDKDIASLRKRSIWVNVFVAVLTSVITFLVLFFFNTIAK